MVDEVAWGIGWGTEGDVTPAESDEEQYETTQRKSIPPSRSRSRAAELPQDPTWEGDECWSRPSLQAASRRSSSRVKRSLSRAPVLTDRSSSARGHLSRQSRPPSPSFSALNSSILSPTISTSSSSSSHFHDSALLTSPTSTSSIERGRRPKKNYSGSRSPSQSAPTTPIDIGIRFPLPSELTDDHETEPSRGRGRNGRPLLAEHLYTTGVENVSELEVLDETAGWAASDFGIKRASSTNRLRFMAPPDASGERDESAMAWKRDAYADMSESLRSLSRDRNQRAGSTPPVSWLKKDSVHSRRLAGVHPHGFFEDPFLTASDPAATPSTAKYPTRSRSMGHEGCGEEAYLPRLQV